MKKEQTQFNDILFLLNQQQVAIDEINSNPVFQPQVTPNTPVPNTPQAVNMLRNASFSHSWKSWDNTAATDNTRYECAWLYSHPNVANQVMYLQRTSSTGGGALLTLGAVSTGADTITITGHGLYTGLGCMVSGSIPAGLSVATPYWVIRVDANTIQLASSYANAIAGTEIDLTSTTTGGNLVFNYTLKDSSSTTFSPIYSIWQIPGTFSGTSSINQGYTLDAPLTGEEPMASPGYTLYGVFNCAKASQYVTAPANARLGCGLYAKQGSTWDYLTGAYTITGTIRGTVTGGGVTREYKVNVTTNRGFTVNTSTLSVANAPTDADFAAGSGVVLSWPKALNYGVSSYDVYRLTSGTYKLLIKITNGVTTYIDNGVFLPNTVSGFPSADFTGLYAYTASIPNVLTNLAVNAISPSWDTIPYAIRVPANYDLSTTDLSLKQWIRWNVTGLTNNKWDVYLTDAIVELDEVTVTSAAGQFTSDMVGLDVTIYAPGFITGDTYTGTVASYTSATEIVVTPAVDLMEVADTPVPSTTIHGGAPLNSMVIDLAHCSYGANAIFAFNSEDFNGTHGNPPCVPNGSGQGGTGTVFPTPGDGQPTCVWIEQEVSMVEGIGAVEVKAKDVEKGDVLVDCAGNVNLVEDYVYHVDEIYETVTENGFSAVTTLTHKYFCNADDKQGIMLMNLRVGDEVLTKDGVSRIASITHKGQDAVAQFFLSPGHGFIVGGIGSHNAKPIS